MLHVNLVVLVCLAYVLILFGVAFAGDRRARPQRRLRWRARQRGSGPY